MVPPAPVDIDGGDEEDRKYNRSSFFTVPMRKRIGLSLPAALKKSIT